MDRRQERRTQVSGKAGKRFSRNINFTGRKRYRMKIAVVYNRESQNVINLFGQPNREKYGKQAIKRIVDGLKKYGHQVRAFEGDKDLIHNLESFMPRVVKSERPGMVFNLSYGIQGQARYTHVPGILEMVGIPYVGSGPLAHSLALDKVVAKMIFLQNGIPTPPFAVLDAPGFESPGLSYPLIVKPKNESVSMGLKVVDDEQELREAAQVIFDGFDNQPVLVEQYIEGREVNVGLIGNSPPEALPPCEIVFGSGGPNIYTSEDKTRESGREITWACPAPIGEALNRQAIDIAQKAFSALGCFDCARVDMRLDEQGNLYVLEINSLPSLGEHGSYVVAAETAGLDFAALVNRLVEVASARYFGTPAPPALREGEGDSGKLVFSFLTNRRDQMEKQLAEWTAIRSRTSDPVGNSMVVTELDKRLREFKMKPVREFTDTRSVWTWETSRGFDGGTLFIGHTDVPLDSSVPSQIFRRDPEWLCGEGIGVSRAPLVMLQFVLRGLRHNRLLHRLPIGVLYYLDEGRDCRYSAEIIREAASRAGRVFVLRPGSEPHNIRIQRRGQRKYNLTAESRPVRVGKISKNVEVLPWFAQTYARLAGLSSKKDRVTVSIVDVRTESFRMFSPHRLSATIIMSYLDQKTADEREEKLRGMLRAREPRLSLEKVSDRPPMKERRTNLRLARQLADTAATWDIPLEQESSLLPSVGGLVPYRVPVVCGVGPVARDLYTPREAVNRVSLIQRALLLTEFLACDAILSKDRKRAGSKKT